MRGNAFSTLRKQAPFGFITSSDDHQTQHYQQLANFITEDGCFRKHAHPCSIEGAFGQTFRTSLH